MVAQAPLYSHPSGRATGKLLVNNFLDRPYDAPVAFVMSANSSISSCRRSSLGAE
jgi:hypothetical protein